MKKNSFNITRKIIIVGVFFSALPSYTATAEFSRAPLSIPRISLLSIGTTTRSQQEVTEILHMLDHMFGPIPRNAIGRIASLIGAIKRQVDDGKDRSVACMQEVHAFLLHELTMAFRSVATIQNADANLAEFHAQQFLYINIESPYLAETTNHLFYQKPYDLPEHIFSVYFSEILIPHFSLVQIPRAPHRGGMETEYMCYLIMIRIILSYVQTGITITNSLLDALGVPQ